jgi:hypothetical protein
VTPSLLKGMGGIAFDFRPELREIEVLANEPNLIEGDRFAGGG